MSSERLPNIGLLTTMASEVQLKTEHQWRDSFAGHATVTPVRFDNDPRERYRSSVKDGTVPISEAAEEIDGLIITGANLERRKDGRELPFEEISFYSQLKEAIDWAGENSKVTIYSCLASHIALNHLFGLEREIQKTKTFGVFDHEVVQDSWLTSGLDIVASGIKSPHSRWGNIPTRLLEQAGVSVLSLNEEAGWLLAESGCEDRKSIFIQGHPEYQRDDLHVEYARDRSSGQSLPKGYYPADKDPFKKELGEQNGVVPLYEWNDSANVLFRNIAAASLGA